MDSFRMDWLDLLAVQGTLKSLLQHHSSKTAILQRSAFFTVQLSHPYMLLLLLSHFSHVQLCVTPWTAAYQAPLSMGFSRQEYWTGLPLPSLHPYMTTGKNIALTRQTFVGKVMSLLFNMLSRLVIAFLPRSKRLLISWLHSPSAVILEPQTQNLSLFPLFPHLLAMKRWDQMP